MNRKVSVRRRMASFLLSFAIAAFCPAFGQDYDIVISNGRVMDPETGLDAIRNVGIRGEAVVAISDQPMSGATEVDAAGLVVAPGFIDLHSRARPGRAILGRNVVF